MVVDFQLIGINREDKCKAVLVLLLELLTSVPLIGCVQKLRAMTHQAVGASVRLVFVVCSAGQL